jgi:NAD(P)-dependent dehydrogenase (short-subunit alcohol dehydrogenase family)
MSTPGTILITGANRGIGLELTRCYATAGWRVFACCREPSDAHALRALAASQKDVEVEVLPLDVTDTASIEALAEQLAGEAIDILLNNAGLYGRKGLRIGDLEQREWLEVLATNAIGPALVTQALLPHLLRGERRVIATLSSKVGSLADNTSGGNQPYRSSKAAVNQVMKSLAIELAHERMIAVALHPGWVQTDMGGPNALISTHESARGIVRVIESLTLEQSGSFLDYRGQVVPW